MTEEAQLARDQGDLDVDAALGDIFPTRFSKIFLRSLKIRFTSEKFILNLWESFIVNSVITLIDSKTKLQEYSLKKFKKLPKYTFFKKTGPQHKPIFKTEVEIPESKKIIGEGTSKKKAQQNAAEKLIKILNI